MRLIELHILQSFPVSCLNRDDVGAPKTAVFGGASSSRISSQCLKRAIREHAKALEGTLYAAMRSRAFTPEIAKLLAADLPEEAEGLARCAAHYLGKLDPTDDAKVKTLMFLSPQEYARLAKLLARLPAAKRGELRQALARVNRAELEREETEVEGPEDLAETSASPRTNSGAGPITAKQFSKIVIGVLKTPIKKEFGTGFVKDAADIAIFGRMVASDPSLTLEGAGLFSHALSTHKAENDIDFFSAVDDLRRADESGVGMTGTLEFTSATYYRYVGLNLGLLADGAHLGALSADERRTVVDTFLRAAILAVPGARKNSMNAHTAPGYVLGLVKDKGQPLQLINAFEKPVSSRNGHMEASISALRKHHEELKNTWGIEPAAEIEIPDKTLDGFCKKACEYVV